jgi:putative nucleotidyltransferase with HDIG domain
MQDRTRGSCTIGRMTVPGRVDAAALLLSLDPPAWFLRHSQAVAEVASWLAERIEFAGVPVDRLLVETAALLHDVDKLLPADDRARALPHGEGSADWLARQGHPELGRAVANHPVTKLVDGEAFRRWAAFATHEERIVAYADKRAGQRLESMDERFTEWSRRHAEGPGSDEPAWSDELTREVRARAERLEGDVCRAADVTPADVGRSPWTAKALQSARERMAKRR